MPASDIVSRVADLGMNVVRVVDFLTVGTNGLQESDWVKVDQILAECREQDLYCWLDLSAYRNLLIAAGTNPYSHDWEPFLRWLAARVNTVNGRTYGKDKRIACVAFAGEPEIPGGENPVTKAPTKQALIDFYDGVLNLWGQIAPGQLRCPGGMLFYSFPDAMPYMDIFQLPGCDVPAVHVYSNSDHVDLPTVVAQVAALGKPLVVEESGRKTTDFPDEEARAAQLTNDFSEYQLLNVAGVGLWHVGTDQPDKPGGTFDVSAATPIVRAALQSSTESFIANEPVVPPPPIGVGAGRIYVDQTSPTRLLVNGETFRSTGTNWHWAGLRESTHPESGGATGHYPTHTMIDTVLDECVATGMKVIRAHTLGISAGTAASLITSINADGSLVWNTAAWEPIDYAIAGARSRGLYFWIPFTDQWKFYHLGKAWWVHMAFLRRTQSGIPTTYSYAGMPGGVPETNVTDTQWLPSGTSINNSKRQLEIEQQFYSLPWIKSAFYAYVQGWLQHVNQYSNVANKDEPAVAFVSAGNELWDSGDEYADHAGADGLAWQAGFSAAVKAVAPHVLVVDPQGANGADLNHAPGRDDPNTDVLDYHLYGGPPLTAAMVTDNAAKAAAHGKAMMFGEYPQGRTGQSDVFSAIESTGAVVAACFWAIYTSQEGHTPGGADDTVYVVGSANPTFKTAMTAHAAVMNSGAVPTPPPPPVNIMASSAATMDISASSFSEGSGTTTLSIDPSAGIGGGPALKMSVNTAGYPYFFPAPHTLGGHPVTPGQQYSMSADVRVANGSFPNVVGHISWYSASGSFLSGADGASGFPVGTSGWTHVIATLTAPADAAYAVPQLQTSSQTTAGSALLIDQLGVYAGTSASPWSPPVTAPLITKGSQLLTTGMGTGIKRLGIAPGDLTVRAGGSLPPGTYEGFDFTSGLRANNAGTRHFKKCRVAITSASYLVDGVSNAEVILEDCEIVQLGDSPPSAITNAYNLTILRSELAGGVDIIKVRRNLTVEDSWLHGIIRVPGGHHDILQTAASKASGSLVNNVRLLRNRIETLDPNTGVEGTRCLIMSANDATIDDWKVKDNFFNGGSSGSTQWGAGSTFSVTNVEVSGNQWGAESPKPAIDWDSSWDTGAGGNSWDKPSNVYLATGLPVRS